MDFLMKKDVINLIIIILFSTLGMKALFHPGLFTAHDISHQVVRLYYYYQALNDGQFPPYWVGQLANGFGYPLFMFSYHLPWILGSLFMKSGVNISDAIKALFFVSYLISGLTMYFFISSLLKSRLAALVSALLYLWLPYHFMVVFVGASLGIAFVFIFIPLIFWGIHLIGREAKPGVSVLSLGIAGVILSHIMHLVFLFPTVLIFTIWEVLNVKSRVKFSRNISYGIILAVLVSSFYLIPAIFYRQFTKAPQESGFSNLYERHFVNFNQILYSKWGFAPIVNNAKNGEVSFQLGISQWLAVVLLSLLLIIRKVPRAKSNLSIFILFAFAFNIFLMLDYSKFVWSFLIRSVSVDFPFRLLLPASFISSVSAGIVIANTQKKLQIFIAVFFIALALYTNRNHINVNLYTNYPVKTYLDLETEKTTNTFNEYLPVKADGKLLGRPWNEVMGDSLLASNTYQTTNLLKFNLKTDKEATFSAGQFFFPGQTLYMDNKITPINIDLDGRIYSTASRGTHIIEIKYEETTLIKISKVLTLIGILIFLFLFFREKNLREKLTSN